MAVGAVIRLTRLITHDTITAPLRSAAARYDVRNRLALQKPPHPGPGPALTFITCPWCISVYIAAAVFAAWGLAPEHCRPHLALVYAALTASWITGTALTASAHTAGPPPARRPAPRPPAPPTPPAGVAAAMNIPAGLQPEPAGV